MDNEMFHSKHDLEKTKYRLGKLFVSRKEDINSFGVVFYGTIKGSIVKLYLTKPLLSIHLLPVFKGELKQSKKNGIVYLEGKYNDVHPLLALFIFFFVFLLLCYAQACLSIYYKHPLNIITSNTVLVFVIFYILFNNLWASEKTVIAQGLKYALQQEDIFTDEDKEFWGSNKL
jgi:hypothetical protein